MQCYAFSAILAEKVLRVLPYKNHEKTKKVSVLGKNHAYKVVYVKSCMQSRVYKVVYVKSCMSITPIQLITTL